MYEYLIKLYLKLYSLKLYDNNRDNIILNNSLEWNSFILSLIKKEFIIDLLEAKDKYEYEKFNIKELTEIILKISVDYQYYNEILILCNSLTDHINQFNVKNGPCGKCIVGIWDKKCVCVFHNDCICKLEAGEYYSK